MAKREISDARPDGQVFGRSSTDKIGFYGLTTPIVRPTITAATSSVATTTINETRIDAIIAALSALGLVTEA